MKKILNADVTNVVEESLNGYLLAYKKYYKKVDDFNAFYYRNARKDKVALVIGGGIAGIQTALDIARTKLRL